MTNVRGQGRVGRQRLTYEVLTVVVVGVAMVVSAAVVGDISADDWRFAGVVTGAIAMLRGARWWAESTSRGGVDSFARIVVGNLVAVTCLGAGMRWILGEPTTAVWVMSGLLLMAFVAIDLAIDRGRRTKPRQAGPLGETTG